jgi:hypothetical protein
MAPALPRRALCLFRAPRPKPRLPEKVGTPVRKAARVVRGGARPPPLAHRDHTEGEGLDSALGCGGGDTAWAWAGFPLVWDLLVC